MDKLKNIFTDVKWIVAIVAAVYAICVHVYVMEGLPNRVKQLEDWRTVAEEHHHKIDLVQTQIQTSLRSIETNVALLLERVVYDRPQRM